MAAKKRKVNVDLADIEARIFCQEQAHLETMAQTADLDAGLDRERRSRITMCRNIGKYIRSCWIAVIWLVGVVMAAVAWLIWWAIRD